MEEGTIEARTLAQNSGIRIIDIRKAPDDRQIPRSEQHNGEQLVSGDQKPFAKDEQVVLYCGSGNSCSRVAAQLRDEGFDVLALEGGYKAWKEAGLPTEPLS
jgi:hydroxyacylglutathione hydrolase